MISFNIPGLSNLNSFLGEQLKRKTPEQRQTPVPVSSATPITPATKPNQPLYISPISQSDIMARLGSTPLLNHNKGFDVSGLGLRASNSQPPQTGQQVSHPQNSMEASNPTTQQGAKPVSGDMTKTLLQLKVDIDAGMPASEMSNLYKEIPQDVRDSLYKDISSGMPVKEASGLYPELSQETAKKEYPTLRQDLKNGSKDIAEGFLAPIKSLGEELKSVWEEQKKDSADYINNNISTGSHLLQTTANASRALVSPITALISPIFSKIGHSIPDEVKQGGAEKWQEFIDNTQVGQALGATVDAYKTFAEKHPEAIDDMGAVVEIATNVFGTKVAKVAGKEALKQSGKAVAKGVTLVDDVGKAIAKSQADNIAKTVAKKVVSSTDDVINNADNMALWNEISPDMTKSAIRERATEGLAMQKKGILKETQYLPRQSEVPLLNTARQIGIEIGAPKANNIKIAKAFIKGKATELRTLLKEAPLTYTPQELMSRFKKIEKPLMLKSDATLSKTYDLVIDRANKIAREYKGNIEGLLDGRQEFDDFISKELPNLYDSDKLTPMRSAVKDVRSTFNDLINDKVGGDAVKSNLKLQSQAFDIVDNLAGKADQAGSTSFTRRTKNNPKKYGVIGKIGGSIVGGGAVGGAASLLGN